MKKTVAVIVALFCAVIISIGFLLANAKSSADVPLEIAKGLISLATALLITGLLSYFLSERSRKLGERADQEQLAKAERADQERVLISVLQDLNSAHENTMVAQFRLGAEPSPMQLREQLEVLIEVRARLQHLRHERIIRQDEAAVSSMKDMGNYIRDLGKEYIKNLPIVSRDCMAFERDTQNYLRGSVTDPPSVPMLDLQQFPELKRFLDDDAFDKSKFRVGYRNARSRIEEELRKLRVG